MSTNTNQIPNLKKNKTKTGKHKFKKLNCHPKHKTKKFTCYDDNTLIMFKNLWNKKHQDNPIQSLQVMDIWTELQKKIPTCTDELCWADKEFQVDKKNHFTPNAPKDWETNLWLSNFDIENVLKQYKEAYPNFEYLGPSPIDFDTKLGDTCVEEGICKLNISEKLKNGINKIGVSINLDTHEKGGSHWVTLFIDLEKKFIFYFDSCGEKIPKQIKDLMDRVEKQCTEAGLKLTQHDSEKMKHQHGTTECGMYSLYCIVHLLEGKHTIDYFKKRRIPDKDVARYRKIYFN
jgi:hypothetical protein